MVDEKYPNLTGGSEACRQFDREVADYLDGENRPGVLAHARECVFCGVVLEDLRAVVSGSKALAFVDPPARVWANIRATLVAEGVIREPESEWKRWLAPLAHVWRPAPVLALAGMIILAVTLTIPRPALHPTLTETSSPKLSLNEPVAPQEISSENIALTRTVNDLERDYQSRKTSFEPAVKDTYDKSLASLDNSIHEASVSVEREPDNSLAREYLLTAYQQKAEVLSAALEFDGR
jgi:hypothetical protein